MSIPPTGVPPSNLIASLFLPALDETLLQISAAARGATRTPVLSGAHMLHIQTAAA